MRPELPSRTALVIAASQIYLAADPALGQLVSGQTVACCRQFLLGAGQKPLLRLAERPRWRRPVRWLERCLLPGLLVHYALRKRFLRDWAEASLRDGYRQLVVIGAGFDTLALELAQRYPEARFVEIDHPATQAVKYMALHKMATIPGNLGFVSADLCSTPLGLALAALPCWSPAAPTLYVAEGVLMYLRPRDILGLLAQLRRLGPGRVAFSFLELQADGRPNFRHASRWVDWWLRLNGEPFTWGIASAELRQRLVQAGGVVRDMADADTLAERYLVANPGTEFTPLRGEQLCVADFPLPHSSLIEPVSLTEENDDVCFRLFGSQPAGLRT